MKTEKLTIEVTDNQMLALRLCAKWEETTVEDIIHIAINNRCQYYIEQMNTAVDEEGCNIFRSWLEPEDKESEVEA